MRSSLRRAVVALAFISVVLCKVECPMSQVQCLMTKVQRPLTRVHRLSKLQLLRSNHSPQSAIRNPKFPTLPLYPFPLTPLRTSGGRLVIPATAFLRVFCRSCLIDFARLRDQSYANRVDSVWVSR